MIFTIIVLLVGIFGLILLESLNEESNFGGWLFGVIFGCALLALILQLANKDGEEMSLVKYTLKIEVRESIVNGNVVKSDTVYIFTERK